MLTRPGHEPTIYRIGSRHANDQRTRTGFCRLQLRDEIGMNISFFRTLSAHKIRYFIVDKTSDPPYDLLSECHLAHRDSNFYWSYFAVTNQVWFHCWITSLRFLWDWIWCTLSHFFYRKQIIGWKGPIFGPKYCTNVPIFTPIFGLR